MLHDDVTFYRIHEAIQSQSVENGSESLNSFLLDLDQRYVSFKRIFSKGITAYMQIRRCMLKFCQTDKISTCTCIFNDAEIL